MNRRDQVVLITGGGRGLGRAFAQALAQAGAQVAVTARSESELAQTVELIELASGRPHPTNSDSSKETKL